MGLPDLAIACHLFPIYLFVYVKTSLKRHLLLGILCMKKIALDLASVALSWLAVLIPG